MSPMGKGWGEGVDEKMKGKGGYLQRGRVGGIYSRCKGKGKWGISSKGKGRGDIFKGEG